MNKDESAVKKQKVITWGVEFESSQTGVVEEITAHGNVDLPAAMQGTLDW